LQQGIATPFITVRDIACPLITRVLQTQYTAAT